MAGIKSGKKVIAVDLGGTNLRVSLVKNGKILQYIKKTTPKSSDDLIFELEDSISQLMTKDVKGIGIGSPGPLKDGIIKNPPNLPLRNFNLKKHLENKFKKKVEILNDVQCVALAEANLGCKKKNFIVIAFGTGIGGGLVINGKIYTGQGYGGEIGHIILDSGKFFEILWQDSRNKMKTAFGENILIKDMLGMKNPEADGIMSEMISYIGKGIGSLINVFDPEVVVLNGGFKETGEALLNKIRIETKKYITLPKETPIVWSKLDHPGTIGASLLV